MSIIGETIRVLSVNTQGLQDFRKRQDVLNYSKSLKPNILCLQDTHWVDKDIATVHRLWDGEIILNGKKTNSRGVSVLLENNFQYKIENIFKDEDGNLLIIDLKVHDINLKLIILYGPNNDSPEFFENLRPHLNENEQDYILICGDMNLVLDPGIDSNNYININNPKARLKLLEIMNEFDLIDIYRQNHPGKKRYTWRRKRPIKQARLDYFIVSNTLSDIISSVEIRSSYRSDHSVIELNILINKFIRNRGRWLFNTSLLKEPSYVQQINEAVDEEKF